MNQKRQAINKLKEYQVAIFEYKTIVQEGFTYEIAGSLELYLGNDCQKSKDIKRLAFRNDAVELEYRTHEVQAFAQKQKINAILNSAINEIEHKGVYPSKKAIFISKEGLIAAKAFYWWLGVAFTLGVAIGAIASKVGITSFLGL